MRILGIRVDPLTMQQTIDIVEAQIRAQEPHPAQVDTLNPEGLELARTDPLLQEIIEHAIVVTPDGHGILWAAEQLGRPLPERVTGIDLMQRLCDTAAAEGWRVFLLGAAPGVAEECAAKLVTQEEWLNIVGYDNGYFQDREQEVIDKINAARPQLLFLALGMPYQEKWLYQHREQIQANVAIGVGGSFDVIAGRIARAPAWVQRCRLEWLWRLLRQPSRWRRYLALPRFMRAVKRQKQQAAQ